MAIYVCSNKDCPTKGKVWMGVEVCPQCGAKMKMKKDTKSKNRRFYGRVKMACNQM